MGVINWNQNLSVNIDDMDKQHKKLIDMINQLHEAMKVGKGNDEVGGILNGLVSYTRTHFTAEEKLLQSVKYPDYQNHKTLHEKLIQDVATYKTKYETGSNFSSTEFFKFLNNWLVSHIQNVDKKYGDFIKSTKSQSAKA